MQPLRKSAPGPPNSSDEHVSCTAPAMRNASCHILCICPTPAIVFEMLQKPSRFAHFWQGAQSLAPATRNDIWMSKSAPYPSVFCTFDFEMRFALQRPALFDISTSKSGPNNFEMCRAPQLRALFRHLNFQKWSEYAFFFAFTCKSALCHNGVQFFISHLARWLRTRRFSHWKNTVCRDFPTFSRTWIFFLLILSSFDLLSSSLLFSSLLFSDSSHLCFSSVHIVGSLTSKLPSMIMF